MTAFFKKNEIYIVLGLTGVLLFLAFTANYLFQKTDITSELAWSFLHGKTYFINPFSDLDLIPYGNHFYWPLPPLPALSMIPLVAIFQKPIELNFITFILNLILLYLILKLATQTFKFTKVEALWLGILYLFASLYVSATLVASPYFLAHNFAAIFVFLSLLEYYGKKRFWLIGILIALTFLSRFMAGLAIIFYILIILFSRENYRIKFKQSLTLALPLIFAGCLLLAYNYIRFDNPLTSGYKLTYFYENYNYIRQYGSFSLYYIPTNIYYYFLETFVPILATVSQSNPLYALKPPYFSVNPYGATSFFIVCPLFILIYKANFKIKEVKFALIAAGIIVLILLNYYYNGYFPQIGGRYLNDCLPLLFLVLLYVLQTLGLKTKYKIVITLSAIFNLYLFFEAIWLYY
ncbi:MAG: hypothetical protein NTX82_07315 [Candidatus Parcubacteria bacterium]|nr:hypothetical protein [Candidatus Parcubacteria bacterium]